MGSSNWGTVSICGSKEELFGIDFPPRKEGDGEKDETFASFVLDDEPIGNSFFGPHQLGPSPPHPTSRYGPGLCTDVH